MCGIAGLWYADPTTEETALRWIDDMTARLVHRGPDASGSFFESESGVGFGHRRLSIVDLSERGRQPMWSNSGRLCITYNGEVYNAPEIREELERLGHAVAWRGHSDTEVVLEAIEAFGLTRALERFRGMFAFALWDREARNLSLVRDRLGIKPLVYVQGRFGIAFASELQALYELPFFRPRLNRSAVAAFLRYGVVPEGECIVEEVCKVRPGTVVHFTAPRLEAVEEPFWSAQRVAEEGLRRPFRGSPQEATDELERRIMESVSLRMRSDVPFGAFLSGGIDSSTVVALMQQAARKPVKTFCIGNVRSGYDESKHAVAVAQHLGCDHLTVIAEPARMLEIATEVASRWDEPFADSSQIPTLMVSRLTREHVTVSLSGDGGDELFGGYNRHAWAPRLWGIANRTPKGARKALGALRLIGVDGWDRAFRAVGLGDVIRLPGDKLHKVAALAEVEALDEFYGRLRSHWTHPEDVLGFDLRPPSLPSPGLLDGPFSAQMMLQDLVDYLPSDILTKVDRASMSTSLEARVPLLDHHVVEFAWQIPLAWKIHGRTQKWILRQVLTRHVPNALFERAKMGFGVPIGEWLRGPLRDWGLDMLDQHALRADGVFDPHTVSKTWRAHQAGRGNHEHQLWALLMFQSWWTHNRASVEA